MLKFVYGIGSRAKARQKLGKSSRTRETIRQKALKNWCMILVPLLLYNLNRSKLTWWCQWASRWVIGTPSASLSAKELWPHQSKMFDTKIFTQLRTVNQNEIFKCPLTYLCSFWHSSDLQQKRSSQWQSQGREMEWKPIHTTFQLY